MAPADWSAPETEVVDAIAEALDGDREAVLATVVAVEGSAYRRPGAKMVVAPDGDGVGAITAGCLEDEVRRLAASVLDAGRPRVDRYDLTGDDDVWGLGVGCNGVIDVLLEPLGEDYRPVVEAYDRGEDVTVATVLESDGPAVETGDRVVVDGGGPPGDGVAEAGWPDWLADGLAGPGRRLAEGGRPGTVTVEDGGRSARLFVDFVRAPPTLVVLGTGHDVVPVAALGRRAGFEVAVVGFRGADATADRFPAADRVVATRPSAVREAVDLDGETYAVVMTHNFLDDRLALDELLQSPVPYVGLMGPRKRFEEMREEFAGEGRRFAADELDRLYTPVGLDLGAGSPPQVALSVVGEVLAVHNDRRAGHLAAREGHIHDRAPTDAPAPE